MIQKYLQNLLRYKYYVILIVGLVVSAFFNLQSFYCGRFYIFISTQCSDNVIDKKLYTETKIELIEYLEKEKSKGYIDEYSIYFRDLNRGPVLGINETETFTSASLLKLPVVMAIFKMAEDNSDILKANIVIENVQAPVNQFYTPHSTLEANRIYTLKDIIEYALIYSDNKAIETLHQFIQSKNGDVRIVFRELGLVLPDDLLDRDVSTRSYTSLFRLLYTAAYLEPEYSEEILEILSRSDFDKGLRVGVPSHIKISHKFGERFIGEQKQLHDCGVVYYPKNPYLLCVMTRGKDFAQLAGVIGAVSEIIYKEVDSRKL